MTDPIVVVLYELAGPKPYLCNAFRLTELSTGVDRRAVLHRSRS